LRILVATDVTGPGGVDYYAFALLAALRRAGHDPVLLCEEQSGSSLARLANTHGIDVMEGRLYRRWYDTGEVETHSIDALSWSGADTVHIVTGSPRSCLPLRAAALQRSIPLMITESQVGDELTLSERELRLVVESYAAAAAVIFVSEGNRNQMRAVGCDSPRSVVVPNGVNLSYAAAYRRVDSRPGFPAKIVCVARLSPEKSISTLIAAVGQLSEAIVASVTVYGEGACRSHLEAQIVALGLGNRVHLAGWTDGVLARLREFDLFALPSTTEGMPYAVLEALAVGLPVVATDVPGVVEALAAGRAGMVVPRSNPTALAGGIVHAMLSQLTEHRARIGQRHVEEHHDLIRNMDRTVDLWHTL
jgi:glycosyltransferase involved in cell wall biosynthesis